MKTYFFSQLKSLGISDAQLNIKLLNETDIVVTVKVNSKAKDSAIKNLPPLTLSGSIEELNDNFLNIIKEPIQKTNTLLSSVVAYEKQLEEKEKATKLHKTKVAKDKENKSKAKDLINEVTKALEDKTFDFRDNIKVKNLISKLDKALTLDVNSKEAKRLKDIIETKKSQPNLF